MPQLGHKFWGALTAFTVLAACGLCFFAGLQMAGAFQPDPVQVQPLEGPVLRVMTFNIRVDTPADGDNAWDHRREMVARTIQFHQVDIAGLQEAYDSMTSELVGRLPGYMRVGNADTMNPILYRESRLELIASEVFWLSETPETESVGWDSSTARTVLHATFRDRRSGLEFHVFNTHFDHRGQEAKVYSGALIAERVKALPQGARVVAMGDFNSVAESDALNELIDGTGLRDAYDVTLAPNHGPSGSFKGFRENRWSGRRVDCIFVGNLQVQQHGIIADHYDGRQPSDHYPVLAELVLE